VNGAKASEGTLVRGLSHITIEYADLYIYGKGDEIGPEGALLLWGQASVMAVTMVVLRHYAKKFLYRPDIVS
jgi:hypothetical protein